MRGVKPAKKFVPIAIESFGRSGEMTQLKRKLRRGNAEIALGALLVDQLGNPLVPAFSFQRGLRPSSGASESHFRDGACRNGACRNSASALRTGEH
mmetsp:Transcript_21241/g.30867  ORF Transcript_21241/g.30867 Transcript_21241/m.30867 type:complete len:96 (-) Transcript_21241:81-368(-)